MRADGRRGGSNSVAYCPHRYCSQPGTVLVQQYDSFATGAIQLAAEPSLKNCLFGTYRASATKISLPSTTSTKPATKRAVPNATNCGASSTTELRNYCRDSRQVALGPSRASQRRYLPMCQSSK